MHSIWFYILLGILGSAAGMTTEIAENMRRGICTPPWTAASSVVILLGIAAGAVAGAISEYIIAKRLTCNVRSKKPTVFLLWILLLSPLVFRSIAVWINWAILCGG